MLKKSIFALIFLAASNCIYAASYIIDTKDAHAFINFKVNHLGMSYVLGSFTKFEGNFDFDENNLKNAKFNVKIDVRSLFSNHAERDKHLIGANFLNTKDHQFATFTSNKVESTGTNEFNLYGTLNLMGVNKEIVIASRFIGAGADPWGGFRAGFEGTTSLSRKDFGTQADLGELSDQVELYIVIEDIRQ